MSNVDRPFSAFSVVLLLMVSFSFAFRPIVSGGYTNRQHIYAISTTSLFYQLNATVSKSLFAGGNTKSSSAHRIPVIGPLFNQPPMLMGATLWLDPPTPLQWKTIEVCVDALAKEKTNKDALSDLATIDAAPLVAVVQEGSELASIAAIVGYQSSTDSPRLDTFDSASLRESLAGLSSTPFYKESTKVRLLCIGRAKLSDLTTKEFPNDSSLDESSMGVTGSELTLSSTQLRSLQSGGRGASIAPTDDGSHEGMTQENDDETQDGNVAAALSTSEPVLMAQMQLVLDAATTATTSRGEKQADGEFGSFSSPVHALSQLSMWSARIGFLHQDRQKLVQGIQAAQTRLEMLSQEWQDWDGLGSLYNDANDDSTADQSAAFDPNAEFRSKINDLLQMTDSPSLSPTFASSTAADNNVPISNAKALSPEAARLLELDNFGLGSTPSAYCDLHSMTQVLIEVLQTYYSPEYVNTEEFEYNLYSWVGLQSMMEFLKGHGKNLKPSFETSNTVDRMGLVYESMLSHKEALRELALAKSLELRDCGEECELF